MKRPHRRWHDSRRQPCYALQAAYGGLQHHIGMLCAAEGNSSLLLSYDELVESRPRDSLESSAASLG